MSSAGLESFGETFAIEERGLLADRAPAAILVGTTLYTAFLSLDLLIVPPEQRWRFATIRLLVSFLGYLGVASMYSGVGRRNVLAVSFCVLSLGAFSLSLMSVLLGGFSSDYYIGNLLFLFFVGLFIPWSLSVVLAYCSLLVGGYFALNGVAHGFSTAALSSGAFLIGTSALTCVANMSSRSARMRDLQMRLKLESANRDLQKVDQIKTRFFSNVSHELRTPLMLILGPLQTLLEGPRTADSKPLLKTMAVNSERLLRQVNMLLDFAKLEAGRLKLSPSQGNVGRILRQLIDAATPFAERRGVKLEGIGLDTLPDTSFDAEHIETVAANLLSNAVKFTPANGTITVRATKTESEGISLEVSDTGPGIPEDQLEAVFDRFHQVEGTDKPEGTGLGLALVKELVILHGGEVSASSKLGEGATFRVVLPPEPPTPSERRRAPRRREDRAAHAKIAAELHAQYGDRPARSSLLAGLQGASLEVEEAPIAPAGSPRVLLVEDNPDLRTFVARQLGQHYQIETAVDGEEGLQKAQAFAPNAIVSDVTMPRMDGHELCRRIKANPLLSTTPVILLTARAGVDAVVEGLNVGADDYVTKPFDMRELRARIDAHLRAHAIERMLNERETRLAAIGQYTSAVAHDVRSPLQAITGHADIAKMIMKREGSESPVLEDLDAIKNAAVRAEQMMQKVVDFARTSSVRLDRVKVDAGALLAETTKELAPVLERAGITLRFDRDGSDKVIEADPLQLRRMVENLLVNARDVLIQHPSAGRPPEIWLSTTADDGHLRIRIADNGPGIPAEIADKLFSPFVTAGKKSGNGLGLAIVANLAKAHAGSVRVEQHAKEGGAAFIVELPRTIPEDLSRTQLS